MIERYTAVDDCGNVINPMIVEGQVHGGIAQSIGQALFEEDGLRRERPDPHRHARRLPDPVGGRRAAHRDARTVTPSPSNPLGVKGIGEAGTIAASAAVVNAAFDALSGLGPAPRHAAPAGARWEAIQQAKAGN